MISIGKVFDKITKNPIEYVRNMKGKEIENAMNDGMWSDRLFLLFKDGDYAHISGGNIYKHDSRVDIDNELIENLTKLGFLSRAEMLMYKAYEAEREAKEEIEKRAQDERYLTKELEKLTNKKVTLTRR